MEKRKLTCDKCTNIHDAQREGKTQDECKCTCHGSTTAPLTNPWYDPCCPVIPIYDPCCPTYPPQPIWQVFPDQLPVCNPFRTDTGTTWCNNAGAAQPTTLSFNCNFNDAAGAYDGGWQRVTIDFTGGANNA